MKQPKKHPEFNSKRHEIDALIQGIGEFLKKKPEKVIKALEFWVNEPKPREKITVRKKAG